MSDTDKLLKQFKTLQKKLDNVREKQESLEQNEFIASDYLSNLRYAVDKMYDLVEHIECM
jgi:uncharacterized protein YutE (UPF0331/DUF86 family)